MLNGDPRTTNDDAILPERAGAKNVSAADTSAMTTEPVSEGHFEMPFAMVMTALPIAHMKLLSACADLCSKFDRFGFKEIVSTRVSSFSRTVQSVFVQTPALTWTARAVVLVTLND